MTELKLVVEKIREKIDLEERYGWASCFDYPEQYDRIEELATEIMTDLEGYEYAGDVKLCLESILLDYDIDTIESISFYTQEQYIDEWVVSGMSEDAEKMFSSLFYFMDSDSRSKWLEAEYLAHDPNIYTNQRNLIILRVNQ